jgi:hypothetical protein
MIPDRYVLLAMSDDALLKHCDEDRYRASGPGGQHRNTTDSAVRLRLPDSDITASASEQRSQHQNRRIALKRLRLEIAFAMRTSDPQPWMDTMPVSQKNSRYPAFVACILDSLAANDFQVSTAAAFLDISTGQLIRILAADPCLWARVNQERQKRDLKPLKR